MKIILKYDTIISFWRGLDKEVEERFSKRTVFDVKYVRVCSAFILCKFPEFINVDGRRFILHPDAFSPVTIDSKYYKEMMP